MITGATPLGAYGVEPGPKKIRPVPILADWIDAETGDLTRLNVSRRVVDGALIEGMRVDRASGPAVMNVGQTLRKVRHTDSSSIAEIPERARDGVRELERLGLVRYENPFRVEVDGDFVHFEGAVTDLTVKPSAEMNINVVRGRADSDP